MEAAAGGGGGGASMTMTGVPAPATDGFQVTLGNRLFGDIVLGEVEQANLDRAVREQVELILAPAKRPLEIFLKKTIVLKINNTKIPNIKALIPLIRLSKSNVLSSEEKAFGEYCLQLLSQTDDLLSTRAEYASGTLKEQSTALVNESYEDELFFFFLVIIFSVFGNVEEKFAEIKEEDAVFEQLGSGATAAAGGVTAAAGGATAAAGGATAAAGGAADPVLQNTLRKKWRAEKSLAPAAAAIPVLLAPQPTTRMQISAEKSEHTRTVDTRRFQHLQIQKDKKATLKSLQDAEPIVRSAIRWVEGTPIPNTVSSLEDALNMAMHQEAQDVIGYKALLQTRMRLLNQLDDAIKNAEKATQNRIALLDILSGYHTYSRDVIALNYEQRQMAEAASVQVVDRLYALLENNNQDKERQLQAIKAGQTRRRAAQKRIEDAAHNAERRAALEAEARAEAARAEAARAEAARAEAARAEEARAETVRAEAARVESSTQEAARVAAAANVSTQEVREIIQEAQQPPPPPVDILAARQIVSREERNRRERGRSRIGTIAFGMISALALGTLALRGRNKLNNTSKAVYQYGWSGLPTERLVRGLPITSTNYAAPTKGPVTLNLNNFNANSTVTGSSGPTIVLGQHETTGTGSGTTTYSYTPGTIEIGNGSGAASTGAGAGTSTNVTIGGQVYHLTPGSQPYQWGWSSAPTEVMRRGGPVTVINRLNANANVQNGDVVQTPAPPGQIAIPEAVPEPYVPPQEYVPPLQQSIPEKEVEQPQKSSGWGILGTVAGAIATTAALYTGSYILDGLGDVATASDPSGVVGPAVGFALKLGAKAIRCRAPAGHHSTDALAIAQGVAKGMKFIPGYSGGRRRRKTIKNRRSKYRK